MKQTIQDMIPQEAVSRYWHSGPGGTREMAVVIGAALLVGLVAAGWAVFLRKKRNTPYALTDSAVKPARRRRKKRDQSIRRNPTLAETGGLRPRDDQPSQV